MSSLRATVLAIVMALVALAALGPAACSSSPTTLSFDEKDQGYSISCSPEWYQVPNPFNNDLQLNPVDQAETHDRHDSLTVHTETMAKPMTLDEFFAAKLTSMNQAPPELELKILEKGSVTLGGQEAQRLVYTMTREGAPVTSVSWFLVKGGRGYTILGAAASPRFEALRPKFEAVAGTFRLQAP